MVFILAELLPFRVSLANAERTHSTRNSGARPGCQLLDMEKVIGSVATKSTDRAAHFHSICQNA